MKLVGLYVENSRLEDVDIPFTSTKVADAVKREFSDAIVLVVSLLFYFWLIILANWNLFSLGR